MARQLSVDEVAARLILSRAQVLGLESGHATAFYTRAFYLRALRKYLGWADIPDDVLDLSPPSDDDAADEDDPDALRLTLAGSDEPPPRAVSWFPVRASIAAGAVVVLAAAGIGMIRQSGSSVIVADDGIARLETSAPIPAQPQRMVSTMPPAVRATPIAMRAPAPVEGATVRLSVGKATWVFVRLPDNRVTERRLAPGEAFEVGPLPVYLAIGTADSVDLRVEDRPVALEPYIRDGQVRITRPELAALGDPDTRH
ncbi:MAG: DUF4115 domain-containing protein [Vicinamibacterales bacterium]